MSELDLARWQFGITTVYHFIFVPLTLGLSLLVAGLQTAWLIKKNPDYLRLTKFFGTLFLINFALGGLATLTLFTLHGAIFLSLKTTGELRTRSRRAALRTAAVAVPIAAAFLLASQIAHGRVATDVTAALAAVTLLAAVAAASRGREGWAFAGTAVTLVLAVATLFGDLWPNVLPSTTAAAYSLTVHNASSSHYTLTVMTWVALIFTPVVLAYQGWTYWVFRHRVTGAPLTRSHPPTAGPVSQAPSGS